MGHDATAEDSRESIQVRIPKGLYRAVQQPLVFYSLTALTGVSITFSPLGLFFLGSWGARVFDVRVLLCFLVTYLIPFVYILLGRPVLAQAWQARREGQSH
jgi:hypothetical protein